MNIVKCPRNHVYDADKADSCPICRNEAERSAKQAVPKKVKVVKRVRAVKARTAVPEADIASTGNEEAVVPESKASEAKTEPVKPVENKVPEAKAEPVKP
ncbi:MAG TPA: hypothetical protein PKI82_02105, partial [Ruminococcus flavefaciens]|nr:hypothetical protein [Ruminococcus flavefaciens]